MNNEPIININLSEVECATLIGLLHTRINFYTNELKKGGQVSGYVDFCKNRLEYYQQLSDKLVAQFNQQSDNFKIN